MEKEAELGEAFGIRARRILAGGPDGLGDLPDPRDVQSMSPEDRHVILDRLRIELYALASIIADRTVDRSLAARERWPPYGLARSLFSDFGVISAFPSALPEGSISDFRMLGKALIDTTVYHLDAFIKELKKSDEAWLLDRLGRVLALFRLGADRKSQARMRDSFSFMYGGLQFGTSTCVQLTEVMARLLRSHPGLNPDRKAEVMKRSIRPAYDLASVNIDDVAWAYSKLQPAGAGAQPGTPANPAGWMDPEKFAIKRSGDEAWKIVLITDLEVGSAERIQEAKSRYTTHGCPARISLLGSRSPIGRLWEWSVDAAHKTGLLEA